MTSSCQQAKRVVGMYIGWCGLRAAYPERTGISTAELTFSINNGVESTRALSKPKLHYVIVAVGPTVSGVDTPFMGVLLEA